jgi:hypothetical protein
MKDDCIYSYVNKEGKFPSWIKISITDKGDAKLFIRGEQFVMHDGFIEPGHLEMMVIPRNEIANLISSLADEFTQSDQNG